ncbi:MarR family transcriptional regulator [Paenibacillus azoreducens]|uniref:HTH-type transcriptional regulator YcgE n=2 Tax=Paenibacillus azoreducens TaxID=116718 RepID=A0A919YBT0_9BACL|nr:putative HTH-type transcriptional regulator YcgE [Paenibacillus azoreducens]
MSSHDRDSTSNPHECLASLMRGLVTRAALYQQHAAASLGLYYNDMKSVDILRERGPITAGELSKITGLATGSVTALIDRLEKAGYVRREHDPNDRRRVILVPVDKHTHEVGQTCRPLMNAISELASDYSADELELITQYIRKASSILEKEIHSFSIARCNPPQEPRS